MDLDMHKILGLRTVVYKVDDLTKGKEWYSKAFDQKPYFDEPFYVGFNIGGYELGLLPAEENEKRDSGKATTYWGVEDIDSSLKVMMNLGASEYEKPTDVGDGIMVASVNDPWGNKIGLIYNPFFKLAE